MLISSDTLLITPTCFRQLQLDSLHTRRVVEHPQQETEYKHHLAVQQSGHITDDRLEQHTRRGC
jgi:hypothetical protein